MKVIELVSKVLISKMYKEKKKKNHVAEINILYVKILIYFINLLIF